MLHFGVLENTPRLLPLLRGLPHVLCMDAQVARGGLDALLVVHPVADIPGAGSMLVPGGFSARLNGAAPQVITYGLSPRDSITISSVDNGGIVAVLQRELITLTGVRVERQEIVCPALMGREATLAFCGSLLLCGVPAAEIPDFFTAAVGAAGKHTALSSPAAQ